MARDTRTGGREATTAVIPGSFGLSVGDPGTPATTGFQWRALSDLARLESGHTPSRSKPEYWAGDIPWIGIRDASGNHGKTLQDTQQHVSQLGLDNSSARLLPPGTVCLSRTASVGYVVTMGRPMATSQDFVNWVCGPELDHRYLHYLFMAEQETIRRIAYGSVHPTMYYPDAKALHVCVPLLTQQRAIAEVLGALDDKIAANQAEVGAAEALIVAMIGRAEGTTRLEDLARQSTRSVRTSEFPDTVAHFSLPAFDAAALPEIATGATIKSNKFLLDVPCVLVSKLNPRIPRIWDVRALPEQMSVASTEFVVLAPQGDSTTVLWAALRDPRVSTELSGLVAGTSGSHQRVKPSEMLQVEVPDTRTLSATTREAISSLGALAHGRRLESQRLAATRDKLLPLLMSGKIRVKDAEKATEGVL
jgi:type I restriction enzyme S subunit